MRIQQLTAPSFRRYGRVLTYDCTGPLLEELNHTPLPDQEVVYVPSDPDLERLDSASVFQDRAFGGLPVQIGYCNGNNHFLNALEYHRSSEINIAADDLILLLGLRQDLSDGFTYDTAKIEGFLVPAGTAVELYATTLHYAPVSVSDSNFRCIVILPKGTNEPLISMPLQEGEDCLLAARNKWLIALKLHTEMLWFCGLTGENIYIG